MSQHHKSKKRTLLLLFLVVFVLFITFVLYEAFLKKAKEVNSGIFKQEKIFTEHTKQLWAVKFSPNDSLLASAGVDSTVRIWKRADGQVIQILKQPIGITSLDFSPDGKYIVTAGYDEIVRIWEWAANKVVRELKGHSGTV